MVVVFDPKSGGFKSVAPTNPIQKAIDKSMKDTRTSPGVRSGGLVGGGNKAPMSSQPKQTIQEVKQPIDENKVATSVKQFTKQEQQFIKEQNRIQPFDYLSKKIPQVIGQGTQDLLTILGAGNVKVAMPKSEIPQKKTISTIPSPADLTFTGTKGYLDVQGGEAAQVISSAGQYAVPYLGETLFLGSLAEKPILKPQEFKQQFKAEPVKTSILYSLGLIGVKGSITNALTNAEIKALNAEIKNAKINFVANADENSIKILSAMKVRGKSFLSRAELRNYADINNIKAAKGGEIVLSDIGKNKVSAQLREIGGISKELKGTATRYTSVPKLVSDSKLAKQYQGFTKYKVLRDEFPFLSESVGVTKLNVVLNTKKGFNIKNGELVFLGDVVKSEKVPYELIKSQVVGTIKPQEVEGLFKVTAGSPKLRIYKNGGVSYVYNPNINGWLKIKPTSDFGEGSTIVIQKLKSALPSIEQGLKQKAKETLMPKIKETKINAVPRLKSKPITRSVSKLSSIQEQAPKRQESIYAGTGQYEKTDDVSFNVPKPFSSVKDNLSSKSNYKPIIKSKSLIGNATKQKDNIKPVPRLTQDIKSNIRQRIKNNTFSEFKVEQRIKEGSRILQKQKQFSNNKKIYNLPLLMRQRRGNINVSKKPFVNNKAPIKNIKSSRFAIKRRLERIAAIRAERPAKSPLKSLIGRDFRPQRTKRLGQYLQGRFQRKVSIGKRLVKSGKLKSVRIFK